VGWLRLYPTEIEADIARFYPGRSVLEWWRGEMSSRELWALLQHLPHDSATQRARRDGDWSEREYLLPLLINEVKSLRADQAALAGQRMRPTFISSPAERKEKVEDRREYFAVRELLKSQIGG
jgi:hypothetical protein